MNIKKKPMQNTTNATGFLCLIIEVMTWVYIPVIFSLFLSLLYRPQPTLCHQYLPGIGNHALKPAGFKNSTSGQRAPVELMAPLLLLWYDAELHVIP